MGLAERRKILELQTVTLPERSREIEEICGKSVPYEVDWASFESDAGALNFVDNAACHRVNMALRTIALDELGRAALRDGLQGIRLRNVPSMGERLMRFEGGVLELHAPWGLGAEGLHRDSEIHALLMSRL